MRNLKNKLAVSALLFCFAFPSGVAAALLPLGFGLALVTGVTASSLILPITAATLVVGAALTYITLGGTPGATADTSAIMVQVDPKVPLPTPPGWTDPVPPSVQPGAPTTIPQTPGATIPHPQAGFASNPYPGKLLACGASMNAVFWDSSVTSGYSVWSHYTSGQHHPVMENSISLGPCESTPENDFVATKSLACPVGHSYQHPGECVAPASCPAGYSGPSGGNCTLANPTLVKKPADSRCFIVRTGNSYGADPSDPDCSAGLPAEFSAGPNSITWTGKGNGDGGGSVTTSPATGRTTITVSKQNADGTTTTTKYELSSPNPAAAPGAGVKVEGISEETKPGVGSLAGSVPGLEIPTDYNRETTQAAVKAAIEAIRDKQCGGPGQPGCKADETGTPTGAGAADAGKGALDALGPSSFGVLPWSGSGISPFSDFPTLAGSNDCVNPISWTWMGHALTPDMCAIWGPLKTSLAWFLYALTALYIWKLVNSSI